MEKKKQFNKKYIGGNIIMDKYTEYILDQIQGLRKEMVEEPVDKSKCDYAINFLVQALVKYQNTVQA